MYATQAIAILKPSQPLESTHTTHQQIYTSENSRFEAAEVCIGDVRAENRREVKETREQRVQLRGLDAVEPEVLAEVDG
jgi:hypothetical protein